MPGESSAGPPDVSSRRPSARQRGRGSASRSQVSRSSITPTRFISSWASSRRVFHSRANNATLRAASLVWAYSYGPAQPAGGASDAQPRVRPVARSAALRAVLWVPRPPTRPRAGRPVAAAPARTAARGGSGITRRANSGSRACAFRPPEVRPHCRPPAGTLNSRSAKELYRVGATGLEPVTPSVSSCFGASPLTSANVLSRVVTRLTDDKAIPPTSANSASVRCVGYRLATVATGRRLRGAGLLLIGIQAGITWPVSAASCRTVSGAYPA
jgi:hypothetical protein